MRKFVALAALMLAVSAPAAFALEAGDGLYGLQITTGTADLYSGDGSTATDYVSAYDHSEIGIGLQYWRMMSADYAFTLSGGIGWFKEKDEPSSAAALLGATDFEYSQTSWNLRLGGDRVVKVGDRAIFYFGPGLAYWSGKAKFEGGPFATAYETEAVNRFGLSGRVGGIMMLTDRVGFNCQMGRYLAYASAEENGAKATWWPSGFESSGGLVVRF